MQNLAKRFKDQPQTPLERAVFWTEYVLRHGNVDYLSPASRDLSIFYRFDLDISAVLLAISSLSLLILYNLIIRFMRCIPLEARKSSPKLKLN